MSIEKAANKLGRIHMMDELRGFAVFCMVFYHGFYSMANLFHMPVGEILLRFFMPAEPWFAGLFICIAGISSNLSRSNLIRGVKLLAVALLVSGATMWVVPSQAIVFGILHFLATCMIVFGLMQLGWKKLRKSSSYQENPFRGLWLLIPLLALYLLTMHTAKGYIQLPFCPRWDLPAEWYCNTFTAILGFPGPSFFSSDYFPILPWCFVFFAGTVLGRLAKAGKFPAFMYKSRIPFFSFLGRHALIIYVVHQPVIMGLCYGIQWGLGLFGIAI